MNTTTQLEKYDQWLTDEWEESALPSPLRSHLIDANQSALAARWLFKDLAAELQAAMGATVEDSDHPGLGGLNHCRIDASLRAIECLLSGTVTKLEHARHTKPAANGERP